MKNVTYLHDARKWAERQILQPFGYELEVKYAEILQGRINPPDKDCGRDIEFRDPTDPYKTVGVQVKTIFYRDVVVRFLGEALKRAREHGRSWTNFCIGEPPRGSLGEARILILKHFEEYGAWMEEDFSRRVEILVMFRCARNEFPPHTVQKAFLIPAKSIHV